MSVWAVLWMVASLAASSAGAQSGLLASGDETDRVRDLTVPALPPGVYLVRVVVREAGAAVPVVAVRRLTMVR